MLWCWLGGDVLPGSVLQAVQAAVSSVMSVWLVLQSIWGWPVNAVMGQLVRWVLRATISDESCCLVVVPARLMCRSFSREIASHTCLYNCTVSLRGICSAQLHGSHNSYMLHAAFGSLKLVLQERTKYNWCRRAGSSSIVDSSK